MNFHRPKILLVFHPTPPHLAPHHTTPASSPLFFLAVEVVMLNSECETQVPPTPPKKEKKKKNWQPESV